RTETWQEEMAKIMRLPNFTSALVLALTIGTPVFVSSPAFGYSAGQEAIRQQDSQIQVDLKAALSAERFRDVSVSVKNGVVDLSGTVELCAYKEDAEKKAQQNRNTAAVRNEIKSQGRECLTKSSKENWPRRSSTIVWDMAIRRSMRSVYRSGMESSRWAAMP